MGYFKDFGKVWIASSPITENIISIKKAINAGADTIVLKSITSIAKDTPPVGKRKISLHKMIDSFNGFEIPMPYTLNTVSTDLDCEMLTINKSNNLYREIKKYSPATKVVASLAPINSEDFKLTDKIEGDAIEISPRWYDLKIPRPYFIITTTDAVFNSNLCSSFFWEKQGDISRIINIVLARAEIYEKNNKEKEKTFREGMQSIYCQRPTLIKVSRQLLEMDTSHYENMMSDGVTFSNSIKGGLTTKLAGVQVEVFNKGSICGAILTEGTLERIKLKKMNNFDKYISASGGILDANTAELAIKFGAGSVQLCSAIYFHGFDVISEIADRIK